MSLPKQEKLYILSNLSESYRNLERSFPMQPGCMGIRIA